MWGEVCSGFCSSLFFCYRVCRSVRVGEGTPGTKTWSYSFLRVRVGSDGGSRNERLRLELRRRVPSRGVGSGVGHSRVIRGPRLPTDGFLHSNGESDSFTGGDPSGGREGGPSSSVGFGR